MENIFISSDESGSNIDTEKSISESNKSSISYVASVNDSEANEVYSNMIGGGQRPNTSPNNPTSPKPLVKEKDVKNFFTGIVKGVEEVGKVVKNVSEEAQKGIKKNIENDVNEIEKQLQIIDKKDLVDIILENARRDEAVIFRGFLKKQLSERVKPNREGEVMQREVMQEEVLQQGGNEYNIEPKKYRKYYEKYLKYKLKYLELKYD